MSDLKNYYEVLEVSSNAKAEDIYHNYQRAKLAYSNDSLALYSLMSPEECRNILDLVEEAYSILSDPQKRKRYDEARGINRDFTLNSYNQLSDRVEPIKMERPHFSSGVQTPREEFTLKPNQEMAYNSTATASTGAQSVNVSKLVTQKRFSLDFVQNLEFEKEIEDSTEFSGEFLRKIREYKNVDIERLADMTKVSKGHLLNIESEDFSKLPAPVYVRGFVFQYAKCLKLTPDLVANSYVARMKKLKA